MNNDTYKTYNVSDIPTTMRKLKWNKSALLMDKWLNHYSVAMSPEEKKGNKAMRTNKFDIDSTTFKVQDLLLVPRVETMYDELISKAIRNEAAQNAIIEIFNTKLGTLDFLYGDTVNTYKGSIVDLQCDWQFQYRIVDVIDVVIEKKLQIISDAKSFEELIVSLFGKIYGEEVGEAVGDITWIHENIIGSIPQASITSDYLDDTYAALGNFNFNAAITEFIVNEEEGKTIIYITEVGVYLRDVFDFIDAQYLGHWNYDGMGVNIFSFMLYVNDSIKDDELTEVWMPEIGKAKPITNNSFNNYRESTGKGGVFYIFSNVVKVDISDKPIRIEIMK